MDFVRWFAIVKRQRGGSRELSHVQENSGLLRGRPGSTTQEKGSMMDEEDIRTDMRQMVRDYVPDEFVKQAISQLTSMPTTYDNRCELGKAFTNAVETIIGDYLRGHTAYRRRRDAETEQYMTEKNDEIRRLQQQLRDTQDELQQAVSETMRDEDESDWPEPTEGNVVAEPMAGNPMDLQVNPPTVIQPHRCDTCGLFHH